MPHYLDPRNTVHWLDDAAHEDRLPANSVMISDARATEIQAPSLNQVKSAKIAQIERYRDDAIASDVTIGARTWPSDDKFKRRLSTIISRMLRAKPAPAKLRGTSGPAINTPTLAQLDNIEDAIQAQEDAAWERYWLLIDAVQAAQDVDSVQAIGW